MPDATFNDVLDAMVRGDRLPDSLDELERFALGLYEDEGSIRMPTLAKTTVSRQLGLMQPALAAPTTPPVTHRPDTRTAKRDQPNLLFIAVSIAAIAAMLIAGVWQLGMLNREGGEDPSQLASAVPTVEVAPGTGHDWLTTIRDCTLPPASNEPYTGPTEFDAREGLPTGPASQEDAEAVAEQARLIYGCETEPEPSSYATEHHTWNMQNLGWPMTVYTPAASQAMLARSEEISAWYQQSGIDLTQFNPGVARGDVPDLDMGQDIYNAFNPELAVQMSDGRVGIPSNVVYVSESGNAPSASNQNIAVAFAIFENVDDRWLADEMLLLCIRDCENYFTWMQDYQDSMMWVAPIAPSECTDLDIYAGEDRGDGVSLAYRSRQYEACQGSADVGELQAPGFRESVPADSRALSDEIRLLYTGAGYTPTTLQRVVPPDTFGDEDVPAGEYVMYDPRYVLELPDGRMAAIEVQAIYDPESLTVSNRTSPVVTRALVWEESGEEWLLDEIVPLCFGNCDEFWAEQLGTPSASPAPTQMPRTLPDGDARRTPTPTGTP